MADLAQLGIQVNVTDQNAAGKLTALSLAADKLTTTAEKLEGVVKKASDAVGRMGTASAKSATQTKTATQQTEKHYLDLLVTLKKTEESFNRLGSTSTGLKKLQGEVNAVTKDLKLLYDVGELTDKQYNKLAASSDRLTIKINERGSALKALTKLEMEADQKAAEYNATLLKQAEIRRQENIAKSISAKSIIPFTDAVKGIIPEDIRLRKGKLGFASPEKKWQYGVLRPLIEEAIHSELMRPYLNPDKAHTYFRQMESKGEVNFIPWRWLSVYLWHITFIQRGFI